MINAVIFDRDGVIIDSEAINIESAVKTFEEFGVKLTPEEQDRFVGMHPADYVDDFARKYDFLTSLFIEKQDARYHALLETVPLIDSAIQLVKRLHREKMPLALTTSSERPSTLRVIKRAGLDGVFQAIVAFEDYTHRKPNPEPYLVTAERLALPPTECLAIEDTQAGVKSAKNAGMVCIAIPHRYSKDQDFSRADLIVASAADISPDLFKNM
jgi:HAD superfamily hydrolase (TIGR01509 family)